MGVRAWLAGGTVRDLLLGRRPPDIDVVTEGDPAPAARAFADLVGGSFFTLSAEFHTCRVVGADRSHTYDFSPLRGKGIEDDLGQRDFTINSLALDLGTGLDRPPGDLQGETIDPFGGLRDLERGVITAVQDSILADDPVRLLRAVRLEQDLGMAASPELEGLIQRDAGLARESAAERIFTELARILELPGTGEAVRRLDALGLLVVLLPELVDLQGVGQNDYHHLDVFEHTLANAAALGGIVQEPGEYFPGQAEWIALRSRSRVAGDASWLTVMGLASLLHDIAKPFCRFTDDDGQVRFFRHDRQGSEMAAGILARFKVSTAATGAVTHLVGKHMRFEAMLQQRDPSRRARVRYLNATAPFTPELIMLSVSDRLSVRGRLVSEADISHHLAVANELLAEALHEEEEPLPQLLDGHRLMRELSLEPGPTVGVLLDHIREEQQVGNIASPEEAIEAARERLKGKV